MRGRGILTSFSLLIISPISFSFAVLILDGNVDSALWTTLRSCGGRLDIFDSSL